MSHRLEVLDHPGLRQAESFVFEESGNEFYDRPDAEKNVTISVSLDEDPTFLHSKERIVLYKSRV